MPGPRFFRSTPASSDPVAHDLYWRNDVQEVPDADQADIYLRFHQSVIEENHESTCFYKTFATLNNFRLTPILLLTVKDIVDCLTDSNKEYDDDHAIIYKNLKVNSSNIIHHLTKGIFTRYPPRIERIVAKKFAPYSGPILFEEDNDDWMMLFDPARVWVVDDSKDEVSIDALVALRSAIHLASRKKTYGIVLRKRDLLVVDNRRALIARQEDAPGFSCRDVVAGWSQSLEGRWLRKIYGFYDDGSGINNYTPKPDVSEKAKEVAGRGAGITKSRSVAHLPAELSAKPCGDVLFDYGPDPKRWPDFLTSL